MTPVALRYAEEVLAAVRNARPYWFEATGVHLASVSELIELLRSELETERARAADAHAQLAAFRESPAYQNGWAVGYRQAKEDGV